MNDSRRHRGLHPGDMSDFSENKHATLNTAVMHLSWLLTRGYALKSSTKLVGDRFELTSRQRTAVQRSVACEQELTTRASKLKNSNQIKCQTLWIDGFNLLTTLESALSGGVLLLGQDGCVRDMASMHGSYRKVEETIPALELIGKYFKNSKVKQVHWLLDQAVSNSGRLKKIIEGIARNHDWNWTAELVPDPDQRLRTEEGIVVSADSLILNECQQWFNAAFEILKTINHNAIQVDLQGKPSSQE